MKTMMIFDQLVNLHRERHRHFRLDPSRVDHGFAAQTNSVPIAMEEVPDAALFYPCVFIEREGTHAMTALLGLRAQHNLFVGPDRQWVADTYVPAHVRRYPFALAEQALAKLRFVHDVVRAAGQRPAAPAAAAATPLQAPAPVAPSVIKKIAKK